MSTLKFPYRKKEINLGVVVEPLIQASIKASYGWQPAWFLVDTGADTTTISAKFATQLGIRFDSREKTRLYGIGKQTTYGYPGKLTLKINGITFAARSYFLDSDRNILLLGRMDLFDKFSLLFDNKNNEVAFKEI